MSKARRRDVLAFVTAIHAGDLEAADQVLDLSDDPRGIAGVLAIYLIKTWKGQGVDVGEGLRRVGLELAADEEDT